MSSSGKNLAAGYPLALSIVFGTYNRKKLLIQCIESCRASVGDLTYEIIVVDGGSTDGSREWLAVQKDVVFLGEWQLEGAIRAFNKGFSLARGWATVNFNDDCVAIGSVMRDAYEYLWANRETVGQIAFYYDTMLSGLFRCGDIVRGYLTANLGMCQTWLGHKVGWWGKDGRTYGGDNRQSMEIWKLGYKVVGLEQFKVHHLHDVGGPRQPNVDANTFWDRWNRVKLDIPPAPTITEGDCANTPVIRPW